MEDLTKRMLALSVQSEHSTWKAVASKARKDLAEVLLQNAILATQISENSKVMARFTTSASADDICTKYREYLIEKYALRRLILLRELQSIDIAQRRVNFLAEELAQNASHKKGHLILLFHFGRYLETMLVLLNKVNGNIVWAGRNHSHDSTYKSFLCLVEHELHTKCQTRFHDILNTLNSGHTVLLSPDSANFKNAQRNNLYKIGRMTVQFDGATDALIEQSKCTVSCVTFTNMGARRETPHVHSVVINSKTSALQTVLDRFLSDQILTFPWKWDRLKYIHRIALNRRLQ